MKKHWLILILALLALAAASFAATRLISAAKPPQQAPCPGLAMLQDYLELTPRQRELVAPTDARYARIRPDLREKLWNARENLLNVLSNPDSTQEHATVAVKRFGAAQQAMQLNTVTYTFELRKHLDKKQKDKLVNLMGRGMCAMSCGQGPGPGMGPGGVRRGMPSPQGRGPGRPRPGGGW